MARDSAPEHGAKRNATVAADVAKGAWSEAKCDGRRGNGKTEHEAKHVSKQNATVAAKIITDRRTKMARKKIIAGNWKMNMTPTQAVALVAELKDLVVNDAVDVVYCVPAIDIVPVVEAVKGTNVQVGAENMYFEDKGAYTGEISAEMLVDAGVKYVIIGHSERRDYFKECDCTLNKKVKKAIAAGLTPILCCGESLEQREMGVTLQLMMLRIWLLLMSRSGLSVPVRLQQPNRHRKSARASATASLRSMMQQLLRLSAFSMADP